MTITARSVQRSLLHRGKITEEQYRALRRPVDVARAEDEFNAALRRMGARYLREVVYHPTKGFRTYGGAAA